MTADAVTAERLAAPGTSTGERLAGIAQRHGALIVLALVFAVGAASFDTFATADTGRNIAISSSFLAVVALGMTFVIITGGIDLSVGSVYALGGVLGAWASQYGLLPALLTPLAAGGAIGLLNGVLIAKARLAPFIVTLASLLGVRGLVLALTDEGSTTYLIGSGSGFAWLGQGTVLGIGVPVVVALVLYGVGVLVLQRTRFGQATFAVGGAEEAAGLMGLPVARVKLVVYTVSGLLAGLAGAMLAARSSSGVPIVGLGFELDAIAAVVIGGTLLVGGAGSVGGTLWGVLLLGVIQNLINQVGSLNSSYQSVVSGAFLVVVVVAQTYLSRTRGQ